MKILHMKRLIEEFKFGMKSKDADSGCMKNKKGGEEEWGFEGKIEVKKRLNEMESQELCVDCMRMMRLASFEAVLGQPG
jgi:hypothetical protein